jgi:hypothetical protein
MLPARGAEELVHLRSVGRDSLAFGVLAVQDADRVGLDPFATVLA